MTHDTGHGEVRLEAHVGGVVTALRGVGGEGVLRFGQRAVGVLTGGVVLAGGVVGGCEVAHFVSCGGGGTVKDCVVKGPGQRHEGFCNSALLDSSRGFA